MAHKLALLVLAAPLFGGCASQIGAFFHRPVVQDEVPGAVSTFSQSADRRIVIIATADGVKGRFCAEPPPDAATGLKTDLQVTFEAQARKLQAGDKLETSVNVLADRTANLDAFRTGVYALCQFNLNGAISGPEVKELFMLLTNNFTAVENVAAAARAASSPR